METVPPEFENFNSKLKKGKTVKPPSLSKLILSQSPDKKNNKSTNAVSKAKLKKGFHLLRKVCYQDMMKPYFRTGNDSRDFQRIWLDERGENERFNLVPQKEKTGFYRKYLLVKPGSKYYLFSWIVYFVVILASFIIIPYEALVVSEQSILSSPTQELMITLDILWTIHICQKFQFAVKRDKKLEESFTQIAYLYIKK